GVPAAIDGNRQGLTLCAADQFNGTESVALPLAALPSSLPRPSTLPEKSSFAREEVTAIPASTRALRFSFFRFSLAGSSILISSISHKPFTAARGVMLVPLFGLNS